MCEHGSAGPGWFGMDREPVCSAGRGVDIRVSEVVT